MCVCGEGGVAKAGFFFYVFGLLHILYHIVDIWYG